MTQTLHYRLTTEEWLAISSKLTRAELIVLYYLRTLDPFGDRPLDLKVIDIAEVTGLTKGTVSKALRSLHDEDLIELEMVTVRVRLNPSKLASAKKFPTGNVVSSEKPKPESAIESESESEKFPTGNIEAPEETSSSCRKLPCAVGNFHTPKLSEDRDSGTPHTIHTDQTNSNSLKRERHGFFDPEGQPIAPYRDWLSRRLSKLPEPVILPELWIDKYASKTSLQREFLKYTASLEQMGIPSAPPIVNCDMDHEEDERGMALARLRAKWNLPGSRAQAIAEAEKWGFQISDNGITDIEEG